MTDLTPERREKLLTLLRTFYGGPDGGPRNPDGAEAAETIEYLARQRIADAKRIAELEDAVRAASALAVCCMSTPCYSREEIEAMARATGPTFRAALEPTKA